MQLLNEIIDVYKKTLLKYVNGEKLIPVSYYCGKYDTRYHISQVEYNDDLYEESSYIEYFARGYKDMIHYMCHPSDSKDPFEKGHHDNFGMVSLREAKESFLNFVISEVAVKLESYGLRHESVVWFLHNYKHTDNISVYNWSRYEAPVGRNLRETKQLFFEYISRIKYDIDRINMVYNRMLNIRKIRKERELEELTKAYINLTNQCIIKIEDDNFGSYTIYDLKNKIVKGYKVTCWSSSHLDLGNCRCVNHDPGYYFEYELEVSDLRRLLREVG